MIWQSEMIDYINTPQMEFKDFDYLDQSQSTKRDKTLENNFKIKYKTERCKNWEKGICEYGDRCAFAHGDAELRDKGILTKNYKTKHCKQFFEQGYCFYGNKCQFSHKNDHSELQNSPKKAEENCNTKRLSVFIDLENRGL